MTNFKWLSVYAFLLFVSVSCSSDVQPVIRTKLSSVQDDLINFRGLTVRKPKGIAEELFDLPDGNAVKIYLESKVSGNSNARLGSGTDGMNDDVFYGTLKSIANKYPLELGITPYSSETLERIRNDFPALKDQNDIQKNIATIVDYYNVLIANEFIPRLASMPTSRKGARSGYIDGANQWEEQLALIDPLAGLSVDEGRTFANKAVSSRYRGDNSDSWRGNAFKHAVWNAEGVRRLIVRGYSQWSSYNHMKKFATAHEKTASGEIGIDENNVMDFHNNAQGRSYMKNNMGWGFFGVRSMPSQSDIENHWFDRCENAILIGDRAYILTLTYNDPYAIADADYVDFDRPVALTYNP